MGMISNFGKFLDPVADKVLVAAVILMLVAFDRVMGISILAGLVILCREMLVSGLREFLADIKIFFMSVPLRTYKIQISQDSFICAIELITEDMVKCMRPGSVIVDLAVEQGGNCPLSEYGEVVVRHDVTIVGHANVPSRLAQDATAMYAKNLLNFLTPLLNTDTGELAIDWGDEIIKACLITHDGAIVHPLITDMSGEAVEEAS